MKNKNSSPYFFSICLILFLCLFGASTSSFAAADVNPPSSQNTNTPEQTVPQAAPGGAQGNQMPGQDQDMGRGFPGGAGERGMGFPPGGGGDRIPSFNQQNTQQKSMNEFISSIISLVILLSACLFVHLYKRKRL